MNSLATRAKSTVLAVAITSFFAVSVYGVDWIGTNSSDWNDPLNWSGGVVPSGVVAAVNTGTNNVPVISSNAPSVSEIVVGGWGGTGQVNHTAGTISSTGWMLLGYGANGTGIYNLADTTTTGGTLTGYGTGAGTLNVAGDLIMGEPFGLQTNNKATVNVNTTGSLAVSGNILVGVWGSTAIANLDAGTVTANDLWVGNSTGAGTFNQSGGKVTETWWAFIGREAGSTGVYNMTGGTNSSANNGELHIGDAATSSGTLNMGGGVISNFSTMQVGDNGTGIINQSAGMIATTGTMMLGLNSGSMATNTMTGGTLSVGGELWVGENGTAVFNQSGGTVTSASWFVIGRNATGVGTYNLSGGTVNGATASGETVLSSFAGGASTLNVSGTGTLTAANDLWVGEGGSGTLNISNGLVETRADATTQLGVGATGSGTINLDGGTLETGSVSKGAGTGSVSFNGGTLKASQSTSSFMAGLTAAKVKAGGATIDSAGFNISIAQDLAEDAGSTGGGLTKKGAGTLTLSGANAYTGTTAVTAGTLLVNGNNSAATGNVTVVAGAMLGGSGTIGGATTIDGTHSPGTSPGVQTFASSLTYNTGATFVWELTVNDAGTRGISFDGVDVTASTLTINTGAASNLTFNGAGSTVNWTDAFWDTAHTWLVFDNASAPSLASGLIFDTVNVSVDSASASLASVRPSSSFAWQSVGNDLYVSYAIPEPSTYALLGLASFGALVTRLRKRSRGE